MISESAEDNVWEEKVDVRVADSVKSCSVKIYDSVMLRTGCFVLESCSDFL